MVKSYFKRFTFKEYLQYVTFKGFATLSASIGFHGLLALCNINPHWALKWSMIALIGDLPPAWILPLIPAGLMDPFLRHHFAPASGKKTNLDKWHVAKLIAGNLFLGGLLAAKLFNMSSLLAIPAARRIAQATGGLFIQSLWAATGLVSLYTYYPIIKQKFTQWWQAQQKKSVRNASPADHALPTGEKPLQHAGN